MTSDASGMDWVKYIMVKSAGYTWSIGTHRVQRWGQRWVLQAPPDHFFRSGTTKYLDPAKFTEADVLDAAWRDLMWREYKATKYTQLESRGITS